MIERSIEATRNRQGLLTVHAVAMEGFAARLGLVSVGDWESATPCTEWDVWALVNHVIGANVRYEMLLGGAPLKEVEATRTLDHLGEAPFESFRMTADAVTRAFAETDVDGRIYHHVTGDRTGGELLVMRTYDIGVHTWDLAVAIGADRRIDDAVVAVALAAAMPTPEERDDWLPQDRLLIRSGRSPHKEEYR